MTMRSSQKCPNCAGQKFAVTDEFRQPGHRASNDTHALSAITIQDGTWRKEALGSFEAWICLHCGFMELYAHDLPHDIEAIIKDHPDQWRIVDARPPEQGPYR